MHEYKLFKMNLISEFRDSGGSAGGKEGTHRAHFAGERPVILPAVPPGEGRPD